MPKLALILILLLFPCWLLAQNNQTAQHTVTKAESIQAEKFFQQGVKYFVEGKYEKAGNLFRKAYSIDRNPQNLYNLAQAELSIEKYGRAADALHAYLQMSTLITAHRKAEIIQEIDELQDLIGFVEINAPPSCDILVDNIIRGMTPLQRPMAVTSKYPQEIKLFCNGTIAYKKEHLFKPGETQQIDLLKKQNERTKSSQVNENNALKKTTLSSLSQKNSAEKSYARLRMVTIGMSIFTGVATGLTIGLKLAYDSKINEQRNLGPPNYDINELDKASNLIKVANVTFVVSVLAGVATTILIPVCIKKKRAISLSATPVFVGNAGFLFVGGNF